MTVSPIHELENTLQLAFISLFSIAGMDPSGPSTTYAEPQTKASSSREAVFNVLLRLAYTFKAFCKLVTRCFWYIRNVFLIAFLAYIAVPIFLKANPWILPKVVFSNIIRWPPFVNLSSPDDFGLKNTRNFYMNVEEDVRIGAWHILPASISDSKEIALDEYEETLKSGKFIFLYLHGNSGTRGAYHRVQIYKFLSKLDAHVLTIDYRGYGDSTGTPTEEGVVGDAYFAFKWLKDKSKGAPIFVWGHSLGTGVTTALARRLCEEGDHPVGIILEAPFNNILEAAVHHPFSFPFRLLPWFKSVFIDSIKEHGIHFSSDENIMKVTPHILILHAEDDAIVPFHLGHKLYLQAKESRSPNTGDVELVVFQGHHGYGHKHIFLAPELPDIIKKFMEKSFADAED